MQILMDQDRSLIHSTLPNTLVQWSAFHNESNALHNTVCPVLVIIPQVSLIPVLLWWERSSWKWVPCVGLFSLNFCSKDESLWTVQMSWCCLNTDFSAKSTLPVSKHISICVCIKLYCTYQSWFAHTDTGDKHILYFCKNILLAVEISVCCSVCVSTNFRDLLILAASVSHCLCPVSIHTLCQSHKWQNVVLFSPAYLLAFSFWGVSASVWSRLLMT